MSAFPVSIQRDHLSVESTPGFRMERGGKWSNYTISYLTTYLAREEFYDANAAPIKQARRRAIVLLSGCNTLQICSMVHSYVVQQKLDIYAIAHWEYI